MVVGIGETPRILLFRALGMFWRKAYIFVVSLVPKREACVDHSWYHSEKGRLFILRVCMTLVEFMTDSRGIKWVLKASLKACQVPKSTGFAARVASW